MEINITVNDVIFSCNRREKKELYKALMEDDDLFEEDERRRHEAEEKRAEEFMLMDRLNAMSPYELKQTLCNLLNVGSYADEQGLRTALEPVIRA